MRSLAARARRLAKHGLAGAWRFGGGGALYRALGGRHRPFIVAYQHLVDD
jgi:hypothetical protein